MRLYNVLKLQRLFVETLLPLIKEGERRGMKLPMGESTHLPSGNPCANLPLYHEKQNKLRVKGNVKNIRFAPQFNWNSSVRMFYIRARINGPRV